MACAAAVITTQDYLDQSLDEIKLLRYVNDADPEDQHHVVRLYDFFYYKVRACHNTTTARARARVCVCVS